MKSKWNDELAQWRSRPLDDLEVVYMWVDGVYVKAGLEKEKAAASPCGTFCSVAPGLSCPRLVVGDGHLHRGALRNVYPQAEQRSEPQDRKRLGRQQDQAKLMLRTIPYASDGGCVQDGRWCGDQPRPWSGTGPHGHLQEHWGHLRTTNPVESPFAALRLRSAAKRYKRVDRAIAVIWKMLMVAEGRFRRPPELIEDVYLGAQYADGIAIESTAEMVAA